MDIKNVETFVKVAELQSFTKAAEEMSYVQSTVTMQIKQLEKELGFPLFDRIGKKISLTDSGREFLEIAYELLRSVEKAESIAKKNKELHGTLRIGVSESLLFSVIADILPEFKEKYGNIEVRIITGHSVELVEQLKTNQLDMLYVAQPPSSYCDLVCLYSRPERIIFVCSPTHTAAQRKLTAAELMDQSFIVTEQSGICYGILHELALRFGKELDVSVEVDSVHIIAELAQKGMGIAFVPDYSVKDYLKEGTLAEISVDIEEQGYLSHILCHKNRWRSPAITGFAEMINAVRPGEMQ